MQPSDFARFRAVMTGMGELYQRELSGPLLDAYWLALRDWDLADFESAAAHLMATATFMPRPADFNALRKAGRPTAGEAWLAVLANVKSSAYRRGVTVGGAADRAVAALGGYHVVGHCDTEKLGFLERRFAEHYDAMQDVGDTRAALPQITATALPAPIANLALRLQG